MKTAPLYRKYRGHVVVVLDPCRRSWNLTRRCTRAKVQEIKTRLRHIMARLEVDPKSFWWEPHVSSLWLPRCSTLPTELDWDIPRQIRSHRVPLAYGPLERPRALPVPGSSGHSRKSSHGCFHQCHHGCVRNPRRRSHPCSSHRRIRGHHPCSCYFTGHAGFGSRSVFRHAFKCATTYRCPVPGVTPACAVFTWAMHL